MRGRWPGPPGKDRRCPGCEPGTGPTGGRRALPRTIWPGPARRPRRRTGGGGHRPDAGTTRQGTAISPRPAAGEWPALIHSILAAGARAPEALAEECLTAARDAAGGSGASILRWHGRRSRSLLSVGEEVTPPDRRPKEGVTTVDGHPVAVVA